MKTSEVYREMVALQHDGFVGDGEAITHEGE